ncbi:ABC-type sugar transport system (probably encoding FT maltose/maltodextrin transporter subunit, also similar to UgpB), ATPase component [Candidatus Phytoplasma mali]|uniref:ABC-type sugar transport system (Probably encoding FT maltose/maltodextrin transporter subunit, also similar to UgpB), ATPase component n=2 Tax=Apple proliferation phytoplasma TaxID=37692 RepID=B3R0I5_PHYMT|nr:ABC-type sugar transport system (probably encoding FT maltose/maltodextrin transporter subunit, also similar to UgpB), ATPase component [Candidatus Phytoplasma mali]
MCLNSFNSNKTETEVQEFQKNIKKKLESFNPEEKDIKIIFWNSVSNSENQMLNEIIESFNKQHPKIKVISVNKSNWPELYKSVSGVLPTDNYPNLVFCYPDYLFSYYYSGKLLPFDEFIKYSRQKEKEEKKEENKITEFNLYQFNENEEKKVNINETIKKDIYSSYWEEGIIKLDKKNEQIFSLPVFKTEELLFYNKTYFIEHKNTFRDEFEKNFKEKNKETKDFTTYWEKYEKYFEKSDTLPTASFTWEQIEILCKTIKDIEEKKNKKVIPFFVQSIENMFYDSAQSLNISSQNNGFFDNSRVKTEILKYFKEKFYDKQYLTSEDLSGLKDNISIFKNKEIYMMINSSRRLENYRAIVDSGAFDLGIAPIPSFPQNDQNTTDDLKTLQQGPSICFFYKKNIDEILASWYFIKYLFSEKVSNILLKAGKFSPIKQYVTEHLTTEEEKFKKKEKKPDLQYYLLKLMDSTNKNKFYTKVFEKSNILREVIGHLFIDCLVINFKNNDEYEEEINKKINFYKNYYNS